MHKTITGLLGAVATLGVAQAAPTPDPNEALKANSFAELLEPIPNAPALLNAMDEKPASDNGNEDTADEAKGKDEAKVPQFVIPRLIKRCRDDHEAGIFIQVVISDGVIVTLPEIDR